MTVGFLKECLNDLPDDYNVVLSKLFAVDAEKGKVGKKSDWYEVILDIPIAGVMKTDEGKEARFVIDLDKGDRTIEQEKKFWEERFGKMIKFEG